jgi:hypothetical protein
MTVTGTGALWVLEGARLHHRHRAVVFLRLTGVDVDAESSLRLRK